VITKQKFARLQTSPLWEGTPPPDTPPPSALRPPNFELALTPLTSDVSSSYAANFRIYAALRYKFTAAHRCTRVKYTREWLEKFHDTRNPSV